jgi:hypothetical protein
MTSLRSALLIIASLALVSGSALAERKEKGAGKREGAGKNKKEKGAPPKMDVSKHLSEATVLHDGNGHYMVVGPFTEFEQVFYGNGKTFYLQSVYSTSSSGSDRTWQALFWTPLEKNNGELDLKPGGTEWELRCGERTTPLLVLGESEAKKMLKGAAFYEDYWSRQAYFLARDDHGSYYYVDRISENRGGKGYRLFTGPKGAMKEQQMLNIVSDSEGDIFATKSGDLRLLINSEASSSDSDDNRKAFWVQKDNKLELKTVPVRRNKILIYAELGVYNEKFGTPCDDL